METSLSGIELASQLRRNGVPPSFTCQYIRQGVMVGTVVCEDGTIPPWQRLWLKFTPEPGVLTDDEVVGIRNRLVDFGLRELCSYLEQGFFVAIELDSHAV